MTDMAIQAFYGMDQVRFTAPTKIGDTLHVELEVLEKQDKGSWGWLTCGATSRTAGEDAAVSVLKVLVKKQADE